MAARGCYYPCYFAVGSVCRCPCGGANHNCGREGAPPQQAVVGGQMLAPAPVSVDLVPVDASAFEDDGDAEATGGSAAGLADWDTEGPPASSGDPQDDEGYVTGEELARVDEVLVAQAADPEATELAQVAGTITGRERLDGTVNRVERVTLQDGSCGYLKPIEQADRYNCLPMYGVTAGEQATHEAAAYHLAKAMGDRYQRLVPITALVNDDEHGLSVLSAERDGIAGSEMQDDMDAQGEWDSGPEVDPAGDTPSWGADPSDVNDGAFFDAVCGNADRHSGNFLVAGDGSVSLIDHGFAFGLPRGFRNSSVLQKRRGEEREGTLTDHERATLTRLSESPNLLGVSGMIGEQRSSAMRGRVERMLRMDSVPARSQ